jgi:hypothetical protein
MYTECLICFDPIRRPWKQPISCDCRPAIHKYCWDSWVNAAGEVCIICRAYDYTPEDVEQAAVLIAVAPPRHPRPIQFLLFLSVLWFLYLFVVIGKIAGTVHDEL